MDASQLVLLAWAGPVFWALGQIWLAKIVVDPLFAKAGAAEDRNCHGLYGRRIPLPVIVPGLASLLVPIPPASVGATAPLWVSALNIATGPIGLLVTVALEIPRHHRLERGGKNVVTIVELIRFNWPRTAPSSRRPPQPR